MRIAIRADSGSQIGGGHVMRCLSLGFAAQNAGHQVLFICADVPGHLGERIKSAGIDILWLKAESPSGNSSEIENWRALPIETDAAQTQQALSDFKPDWLILDHYGLEGAWVKDIRRAIPELRILALDDLDREPMFADLLLNPAAVPGTKIKQPHMGMLKGPSYAMLRPEFTMARPAALKRRTGDVKKVLILPGMVDSQQMAPIALEAMRAFPELQAEVIMGSQSPTVSQLQKLIAERPNWSLTLDAKDMAQRMSNADACIGAGGGSAWERCSLGLPSVNIALAENQVPGVQAIADAHAAIGLGPSALQNSQMITDALSELMANYDVLSQNAAALCDGEGAKRVVAAMSGQLREVTNDDAQLIFDWRNQTRIRDASLSSDPLIWDNHVAYLQKVLTEPANHCWRIYQEDGKDLGLVNAKRLEDGSWAWGFYIGATDAPRGAGRRMLVQFLRVLKNKPGFTGVRAVVLAENRKSIALHEALGFRPDSDKSAPEVHYWLDAKTINTRLGLGT